MKEKTPYVAYLCPGNSPVSRHPADRVALVEDPSEGNGEWIDLGDAMEKYGPLNENLFISQIHKVCPDCKLENRLEEIK